MISLQTWLAKPVPVIILLYCKSFDDCDDNSYKVLQNLLGFIIRIYRYEHEVKVYNKDIWNYLRVQYISRCYPGIRVDCRRVLNVRSLETFVVKLLMSYLRKIRVLYEVIQIPIQSQASRNNHWQYSIIHNSKLKQNLLKTVTLILFGLQRWSESTKAGRDLQELWEIKRERQARNQCRGREQFLSNEFLEIPIGNAKIRSEIVNLCRYCPKSRQMLNPGYGSGQRSENKSKWENVNTWTCICKLRSKEQSKVSIIKSAVESAYLRSCTFDSDITSSNLDISITTILNINKNKNIKIFHEKYLLNLTTINCSF